MNIFNETELYKYFKEMIDKAASKEMTFLENEIATLRNETCRQLNLGFEQRKNETLQLLERKLNRDNQKFLSRLDQSLNRTIAVYRESLVNELLENLMQRFQTYQASDQYQKALNKSLQSLPLAQVETIEVAEVDMVKVQKIDGKILKASTDIQGGYRVHFSCGKMLLDQSIETKLLQVKNWFYENASFHINAKEEVKV